MSYLSKALGELIAGKKLSGAEIVRLTGIDRTTLWRIEHDEQKSITDEDLNALLQKVCETQHERAELIIARMKDVAVGPGRELITVQIGDGKESQLRDEPPASHPFERALATIRAHHDLGEVQDVIISIASLLETGDFAPTKTKYAAAKRPRKAGQNN